MEKQLQDTITNAKLFVLEIYEKHHTELELYSRGKSQNILEGNEIIQEFYLKLSMKHKVIFPKYEEIGVPYLKGIIKNICYDNFNNLKKKRETIDDLKKQLSEEVDGLDYHSTILYERYLDLFEKQLLPLEHQLLWKSIQGFTYNEMAEYFKLSVSNVGAKLSRIRNKVEKMLNE